MKHQKIATTHYSFSHPVSQTIKPICLMVKHVMKMWSMVNLSVNALTLF
uniref:Uncharacterized protein n=1 Tax=Rhizophora mucronata TaxID=61149 RepID=A0A2P2QBD5_RHIMU